jgi:hypothetical protein
VPMILTLCLCVSLSGLGIRDDGTIQAGESLISIEDGLVLYPVLSVHPVNIVQDDGK